MTLNRTPYKIGVLFILLVLALLTVLKYVKNMLFIPRQEIILTPEIARQHRVRDLPSAQIDMSAEFDGYDLPPSILRYVLQQLLPERTRFKRNPTSIQWLNNDIISYRTNRGTERTANESVTLSGHQDGSVTLRAESAERLGPCFVEYSLPPQVDGADWPDVMVRANAHYYEGYNRFSRQTESVLSYVDAAAGMGFLALVLQNQTDDELVLRRETELFVNQQQ